MNQAKISTPKHLWVIGVLALLWNLMGVFDYLATQLKLDFYMSQFTPQQLDYFYGFPAWMDGAWAVAVWGSLLGSLALLLRKAWSIIFFGLALAGLLISTLHSYVLSRGAEIMGETAVNFTVVIWIIALALFFYARAMAHREVLR